MYICMCRSVLQRFFKEWRQKRAYRTFWKGVKGLQKIFLGQLARMRLRAYLEAVQDLLDSSPSPHERVHCKSNERLLYGIRYLTADRLSCGTMCLSVEGAGAEVDIGRPPGHLFRLYPRANRAVPRGQAAGLPFGSNQQGTRPDSRSAFAVKCVVTHPSNQVGIGQNARALLPKLKKKVVYPEIEEVIERIRAKHRPRAGPLRTAVSNQNSGISWFRSTSSSGGAAEPLSAASGALSSPSSWAGESSVLAVGGSGNSVSTLESVLPSSAGLTIGELQHHLVLARQGGEDVVSLVSCKSTARSVNIRCMHAASIITPHGLYMPLLYPNLFLLPAATKPCSGSPLVSRQTEPCSACSAAQCSL